MNGSPAVSTNTRTAARRMAARAGARYPTILCQNDPSPLACRSEPNLVQRIRCEVVVVDLDLRPRLPERAGNDLLAEGAIDEED